MLSKRGNVPGDVSSDCKSIRSFGGPAQMSFLNGISAEPAGAGLQAGWVSDAACICKSTGPFASSLLHKKVTLSVFIEFF